MRRRIGVWVQMPGERPGPYGVEQFTFSSFRLCRRWLTGLAAVRGRGPGTSQPVRRASERYPKGIRRVSEGYPKGLMGLFPADAGAPLRGGAGFSGGGGLTFALAKPALKGNH